VYPPGAQAALGLVNGQAGRGHRFLGQAFVGPIGLEFLAGLGGLVLADAGQVEDGRVRVGQGQFKAQGLAGSGVLGHPAPHHAPAVLYLARIGQYQPSQTGREFQPYWSDKRLAEEAVDAASLAIDEAKRRLGAGRIHLLGYSGGGGLAMLLAQRRTDVASLVTIAGLLDTQWWVLEKNYHPLTGSLNPADQAVRLTNLSQVHFYGSDDPIIPGGMSSHFQTLAPFTNFRRVEVRTNHWKNWAEWWPELLKNYVLPNRTQADLRPA
jgi:poly(3-hydroxybutyrate) depolymerase